MYFTTKIQIWRNFKLFLFNSIFNFKVLEHTPYKRYLLWLNGLIMDLFLLPPLRIFIVSLNPLFQQLTIKQTKSIGKNMFSLLTECTPPPPHSVHPFRNSSTNEMALKKLLNKKEKRINCSKKIKKKWK